MAPSYGDDTPIAAFATTPGISALTLIRCSGKGSIELASGVFSAPEKLLQAAGNTVVHGWIICPAGERNADEKNCNKKIINEKTKNEKIDEVLVSVFRAPKSYTGEDGLDISCHGGTAAGRGVMAALQAAGFREALPGEFTFRAFMNDKLDLTRCESVMELVGAKTDKGRSHAVNRLSGALENEINIIKKQLVEVLSATEIYLDYSEDEIDAEEEAGRLPHRQLALETLARLRTLADSWQLERIYQEGILAVIAGRPNAGKSSLFNLLLKEDRAIVTDVPGTTRDWIEAWVSLEGIPVRLADTAGLRESFDPVEKIGVERSRSLLEEAELVLYLIDGEAGFTAEDRAFIGGLGRKCLVLWNKTDIAPVPTEFKTQGFIGISAKTGEGITELTSAIAAAINAKAGDKGGGLLLQTGDAVGGSLAVGSIGTSRQKKLVEAAAAALEEALALAGRDEPLDLIAPLLREAVNSLGEITGEVSTADILEEMFSKFCVGK